ncbi:MAG: hypothetical protein Q8Q95_01020 [bacterium]|nr:hypothetical protein [bacterium]
MARHIEMLTGQMVDYFIKPHADRDALNKHEGELGKTWLYLLSLMAECFENQPKEVTADVTKCIIEKLSSSSTVELILLALVVNKLTKQQRYTNDFETRGRLYSFKCTLLNLAILHFYWVDGIYYVKDEKPWLNKKERPFLLIRQDLQNQGNLILKFAIASSYRVDETSLVLKPHYMPNSFISLHLPKNTLHPEIAEIVAMYELGKVMPSRPALSLEVITSF